MTPSTRQRTRMLILLVVGVLMGIGAALVAGVQVAQDAVDDAAALDALAGVAESAARLHAATNQVVLVFAASPPDEDGALRLAVAEARATLKALPPAIEAIETIDPTDTVLVSAAGQYMAAVADILDSAETRPAQGSDPQSLAPLELAHRVLIDTIDGRRMIIRSALATSTAGSGVAVVMATGLVVLVLPTGAVLIFSRALRTPVAVAPATTAAPATTMPARLTRELEDRAAAIVDHARIVAWTRPPDHDARPYRGLLSEAVGRLNVTRNLLAFDRLEAGEVMVSDETTDLGELAGRLRLGALDTGTAVEVVADEVVVLADPVRLHQCLENLVGMLAVHGALRIGVVVGRDNELGTVCVAGEGCTLPTEVVRALHDAVRPQRAAALALAVVARLVDAMSGTIAHRQVEATAVFTIALPLAGGRRR